ncbi:unnamed protein product [Rhodiola kirilowii]
MVHHAPNEVGHYENPMSARKDFSTGILYNYGASDDHLPDQILMKGPVHYSWMYLMERQLGQYKKFV